MIVLDENIPDAERRILTSWRIRTHHIGHGFGRAGIQDDEIPAFLLTLRQPTFFTRDNDFYDRSLRHAAYCLVVLDVAEREIATFVRRFLRHSAFDTHAKRAGVVARAGHAGIRLRQRGNAEEHLIWLP